MDPTSSGSQANGFISPPSSSAVVLDEHPKSQMEKLQRLSDNFAELLGQDELYESLSALSFADLEENAYRTDGELAKLTEIYPVLIDNLIAHMKDKTIDDQTATCILFLWHPNFSQDGQSAFSLRFNAAATREGLLD